MASIRKQRDVCEIRECIATERGPRQRPLARFRGALTPDVLDEAEANARLPFDRADLVRRAAARGIPVTDRRRHADARNLLAALQRGDALDPTLAGLLKAALDRVETRPVPEHLEDAADWIGRPERDRGMALRGLLRTADRVLRSRPPLRTKAPDAYPHFSSEHDGGAH